VTLYCQTALTILITPFLFVSRSRVASTQKNADVQEMPVFIRPFCVFLHCVSGITASELQSAPTQFLPYDRHTSLLFQGEDTETKNLVTSKRELDIDVVWQKAICKGQKIFQALTTNADTAGQFINPVNSIWDGPLINELISWGYNDVSSTRDYACDFQNQGSYDLGDTFAALGIGPRSLGQGAPNWCFSIEHQNGPAVVRDVNGKLPPPEQQWYIGPNDIHYQVR
jgi:hypothetical protein